MSHRYDPFAPPNPRTSHMHDRLMPIKWLAPEVLQGRAISFESDVYAFAVTVTEILNRALPFPHLNSAEACAAVLERNERPALPSNMPAASQGLLALIQQVRKKSVERS